MFKLFSAYIALLIKIQIFSSFKLSNSIYLEKRRPVLGIFIC